MPQFGDLEAAVMDVIWRADEPLRVREVMELLAPARTLAYTSVQTVMDNLARKGWLDRLPDGRANRYAATGTREEYVAGLMSEALAKTDDRAAAILRVVEDMDTDEVAQLRTLLNSRRKR